MNSQQKRTFWSYVVQAAIAVITGLAAAFGITACSLTFGV